MSRCRVFKRFQRVAGFFFVLFLISFKTCDVLAAEKFALKVASAPMVHGINFLRNTVALEIEVAICRVYKTFTKNGHGVAHQSRRFGSLHATTAR